MIYLNDQILARLGQAIYWVGCAIALLVLALLGFGVFKGYVEGIEIVLALIAAFVFWAAGRLVRFVLKGD